MERINRNYYIGKGVTERDKEILFSGETSDALSETKNYPQLLSDLGIFKSKSQARQSGWNEIPEGWSDITVGKMKNRICIIKVTNV